MKKNRGVQSSDPIQSKPWMVPIHVQLMSPRPRGQFWSPGPWPWPWGLCPWLHHCVVHGCCWYWCDGKSRRHRRHWTYAVIAQLWTVFLRFSINSVTTNSSEKCEINRPTWSFGFVWAALRLHVDLLGYWVYRHIQPIFLHSIPGFGAGT